MSRLSCFTLIALLILAVIGAVAFGMAMLLGGFFVALSAFFSWVGWWPLFIGAVVLLIIGAVTSRKG
ncbi:hypothetical protein ACXR2T_07660 [Leucobacter sp. HY1910]